MKALSHYVRLRHAPGVSLVAYKTSADVVSKAVTLLVTVAAARELSATEFGVFALAMTSGWLLGVASDAGLPMHLATRVAHAGASARTIWPIVADVMRWRWALAACAGAGGLGLGALLAPPPLLVAFAGVVAHQLLGAVLDTLAHAYRGLGRTDVESSLALAHRGALALAALTALAVRPSLTWLAGALLVPTFVAVVASHVVAGRLMKRRGFEESAVDRAELLGARRFVSDVAPLGLGVLLSAVYFRCDVYFLERWHGIEAVGVYNAAFRIVDAVRVFPAAALAVAYPMLCGAVTLSPLRHLSLALAAASAVVALAIYASAPSLLALVYGDGFAVGGGALRVLAWCVPLFFVNYALTHQLIAWGARRAYLAIAAGALAVNLAGNGLLIPTGGMQGAAMSTLITEIAVCGGCVAALRRR